MIELRAIFKGSVQGIGFRWTLADHAEGAGLVGTATNLKDGSVEVIAQGEKEQLEVFLDAVQKDPGFARIDKVETKYREPKSSLSGFHIGSEK